VPTIWLAAVTREHRFEVDREFRHAQFQEVLGVALGFGFLFLIIEGSADRVMSVMNFLGEIRDRELQLVRP